MLNCDILLLHTGVAFTLHGNFLYLGVEVDLPALFGRRTAGDRPVDIAPGLVLGMLFFFFLCQDSCGRVQRDAVCSVCLQRSRQLWGMISESIWGLVPSRCYRERTPGEEGPGTPIVRGCSGNINPRRVTYGVSYLYIFTAGIDIRISQDMSRNQH